MERNKECPECGCKEISKGKLSGYASMMPAYKTLSMGSAIIADICTNCGHILSMKVTRPEKFR
ncbi:transcription initiation factor TFIIIB [Sporosalibacterium faouarense]|uniref:transcription initiation factor TFIIIB n=1 Tax=Sporosalibacterium faouarense TaxID=516123 RepID=UPI00141D1C6F|nr:transcription initiation factor TFIIIB [Sporosalibacterium faouarense]MTI49317.1 transcription initiation factor TFIIIB [Bacillota bacterium]